MLSTLAPTQKRHRKPIYIGRRYGRLKPPQVGPDSVPEAGPEVEEGRVGLAAEQPQDLVPAAAGDERLAADDGVRPDQDLGWYPIFTLEKQLLNMTDKMV